MELKSTLGGDYNFGEVEKKKLVIAGFDGVALRANLAFTKSFAKRFRPADERMKVFYDAEKKAIFIKIVGNNEINSFKIGRNKDGSVKGGTASALDRVGAKTGKYYFAEEVDGGFVCVHEDRILN